MSEMMLAVSIFLVGCAVVVAGFWYGLRGRALQVEHSSRPLAARIEGARDAYRLEVVADAMMRWRRIYEQVWLDGRAEPALDAFLGVVVVEWRNEPWQAAPGIVAHGQVLNPDAAERHHAPPVVACLVDAASIYRTTLGHELTDAWHRWSRTPWQTDATRPQLGAFVDVDKEAETERRWRTG